MPKLNRTTNICDHCRQYHHQRIPYEPFPYGKKEGVKKCTFCPSKTPHVLCESCYQNSQLELSGSVLQYLGVAICRECLVKIRLTDLLEKLEARAHIYIEKLQDKVRDDAYILTQEMQGQQL